MSVELSITELAAALPPRIWYLTSSGGDMWCRRPYGFFFSTGELAQAFAAQMGTGEDLFPVGHDASALLTPEFLSGLQTNALTRIFVDPEIDETSGDVHGTIVRLGVLQ